MQELEQILAEQRSQRELLDKMYNSIAGNEELGIKGIARRIKDIEEVAEDYKDNKSRFKTISMVIVGVSTFLGWLVNLIAKTFMG